MNDRITELERLLAESKTQHVADLQYLKLCAEEQGWTPELPDQDPWPAFWIEALLIKRQKG